MKTQDNGWKSDIKFLLIDVNFHHEVKQNDKGYVAEIKDFIKRFFHTICKQIPLADYQSFFSNKTRNNIAGKKVRISLYFDNI